jgi:alpha-galactosidase/6-phospho-beta-glucosidase family protein
VSTISGQPARPRRIAVIGAGSAQFLLELAELAALEDIGPYELALCDLHPSRLATVAAACR